MTDRCIYHLGLCLRYLGRDDEAYEALYKSTWNQAWSAAGYHALAEVDCARGEWAKALEHLQLSLRWNTDNLRARNLKVMVLRRLGQTNAAEQLLEDTIGLYPFDAWASYLDGVKSIGDLQVRLDVAHDHYRAGFFVEAVGLLRADLPETPQAANGRLNGANISLPDQSWGALPMVYYTLGWLHGRAGDHATAMKEFKRAAECAPDYCFPARLEDIAVLEAAMQANLADARAPYYLGNLFYDRKRQAEAIQLWERSAKLDPGFSIVWRNLGIGRFNILQ